MNDFLEHRRLKRKAKKKNRKHKKLGILSEEGLKRSPMKEAEEDLAESVDSGCIPDSPSDIVTDKTDTAQIGAALLKENTFISSLLKWLPLPPQSNESVAETSGGKKRKHEGNKQGEAEHHNKKHKVNDDIPADLDDLQERYCNILADMKKNRNKRQNHVNRKKAKLNVKLKSLEKKRDKRIKKGMKLPETVENKKENNLKQISPKKSKPQKPIFNQNGELVFSKFDFSNNSASADIDTNVKSKDLKQILSQALKEKEKMKQLEKKGDKEGAASIAEQKAWSNALQKAEGKKVKSDVDMLKKSIKKQDQRKKTSQKKWEQRLHTVQKNKASKQNQRKKNINARKDERRDKKMKKMKKKGHIVPGF